MHDFAPIRVGGRINIRHSPYHLSFNGCRSKMKVTLAFVVIFICTSIAGQLVTINETLDLLEKFFLHQLTERERKVLQDIFEIIHGPNSELSQSLLNPSARSQSLTCVLCRTAFSAFFDGIHKNQTDDQLIDSITNLCTSLAIESYNVCRGLAALNVPIVAYIVRNTPAATPQTFCGILFQNEEDPNYCPYTNDTRFEWQVDLPSYPDPRNIPITKTDSRPLKAVIITDTHVDPLYEAYGVADCDAPTCCRKGQTPPRNYKFRSNVDKSLYKSGIVKSNDNVSFDLGVIPKIRKQKSLSRNMYPMQRDTVPAGYWGDYRSCDTPIWAFNDVIDRIGETHTDIDVVYYIGDTVDHGVWETSYSLINKMNRYLVNKMRNTFGEDILIVPVVGNHDSHPTNQFAPVYVTGSKLNTTWLYRTLEDKWDPYLTEEAKESFLVRGGFSRLVKPGLRVISINNNIAYNYNWWLVFDPLESKRHLDWLVEELKIAELNGEKVHLLTHIPPGTRDLIHTWSREFNRIINRFASTIKAQFNGHVHSDEFKIFYSLSDGSPINVAWGGGSATTYSDYNLNYKIVEFNDETFELMSIVNYVYNLTEANLTPDKRPKWFELYDMKYTFELTDLSPASMNELVHKMTNQTHFLDLYSAFHSKLSDNLWLSCDEKCKLKKICGIVVTVLWERQKCNELITLYNNNKRRYIELFDIVLKLF